jgi:hypothetical protein
MQGPKYAFPAVSDDAVEAPIPFAEVDRGVSVLHDEIVYEAVDDEFGKGAEIGRVHIVALKPTELGEGTVVARVVFRLFDEPASTLTASGVLPHHADETVGSGRLAILGGTGRFKTTRGELVVRAKNPHRWSLDEGP